MMPLSDAGEESQLPSPEVIGSILGVDPGGLNAAHIRRIKRLAKGYTGCIVVVVDHGMVPANGIYQVKQFIIGPAEK